VARQCLDALSLSSSRSRIVSAHERRERHCECSISRNGKRGAEEQRERDEETEESERRDEEELLNRQAVSRRKKG